MKSILLTPRYAMLLRAMELYGVTELPGREQNVTILKMFKDIGHQWVQDDETSWCSAFVNWVAQYCNCQRSGKLDARSWLKVGTEIKMPHQGDIVIFWRESINSWKGHVGLWIASNDTHVYCLGGNQGNQVNISAYPRFQVLGYRSLEFI